MKCSTKYELYLNNLKEYLTGFFRKTQPLIDWDRIEEQTEEMFNSEWEQGSLFCWEEIIQRMRGTNSGEKGQNPLHCIACNKTYANENVFMHHKKGRPHIKAVNEMSKKGATSIQQMTNTETEK